MFVSTSTVLYDAVRALEVVAQARDAPQGLVHS